MDPQLEQELNTIKAQTSTIKDETNKIEKNTKEMKDDTSKIGQVVSLLKEISGKMFSIDWDERKITISKSGKGKDDVQEEYSKNKRIILLVSVVLLVALATGTILWTLNLFHFNLLDLSYTKFIENNISTFGILCAIIIILSAVLYLAGVLCFGNLRDFLQRDSLSLALVFSCAFLICVSIFIYLRKFDKSVDHIHAFYEKQDRNPMTLVGSVADGNNEPVEAAKVELKGSECATMTSATGAFSLYIPVEVPTGTQILQISKGNLISEKEIEITEKGGTKVLKRIVLTTTKSNKPEPDKFTDKQDKKAEKSSRSTDSESVVHSQKAHIYSERDIKRELDYAYQDCKRRGIFYFKDDEDDIIAAPNNKDIAKKICGNYESFLSDVINNRFSAANNKLVSSHKLYQRIGHKNKDSIELSRLVYLHKYFRTLLCLFTDDCSVVEANLKLIIPELKKANQKNDSNEYTNKYFPEFYYYFKTIEMIIESSSHLRVSSCKKLMRDFNFVLMNELSIDEFLEEFPAIKHEIESKEKNRMLKNIERPSTINR